MAAHEAGTDLGVQGKSVPVIKMEALVNSRGAITQLLHLVLGSHHNLKHPIAYSNLINIDTLFFSIPFTL
jgi:hypothetical protein